MTKQMWFSVVTTQTRIKKMYHFSLFACYLSTSTQTYSTAAVHIKLFYIQQQRNQPPAVSTE